MVDNDADNDADEATREARGRAIRRSLREARIEKKMTQQDVADELGVTRQAVSSWEQFKAHPSVDHLARWARSVNRRLRVQVIDPRHGREPLLVLKASAEIVHRFEALSERDRELAMAFVRRLGGEQ